MPDEQTNESMPGLGLVGQIGVGQISPLIATGRSSSLSSRIIADVRRALGERSLKPGDVLGTEKDLATRYGVSRIVARDALRSLEALGIVEIRMGKGGGARIAKGNPRLFAEALAIQLDLAGIGAGEVLDAQRAIECMAAELAARNATPADVARLTDLVDQAERALADRGEYARLSRAFHFALAEASRNRVLVVQLVSLDRVALSLREKTFPSDVAQRVLGVHRALAGCIAQGDQDGARRVMDQHMSVIRTRSVGEHAGEIQPPCGCW
jgi:GntR family transcriptional repressor for pyruvate dehydrogenase complex